MLPGREQLHQSVAAVFTVQRKGQPYQYRSRRYSETDADSLSDTRHIHDDEHHEYGKQSGGENKQVLCCLLNTSLFDILLQHQNLYA